MKFVSSVSMAALAPKAPAGDATLAPLGAASGGDGVTIVHVALSPDADPQLPRFPDQPAQEVAAVQKRIAGDAALMSKLETRDVSLADVVAMDHAGDGGHIIYVG